MKSDFQLRPLAAQDLERVAAIAARLPEAPHWPPSAYREVLDPAAAARRLCLALEQSPCGELLGFAIVRIVAAEAELETIAIAPEQQRKGFGRRLLAGLLERLRAAQVTEVTLEVRCSNASAIALYKNAGFIQSGKRKSYYADPVEDALLMTLPLRG